ncbi:MAG TPA: hypothetical protein VF606_10605 [Geminicoccaceae bacterium]
MLARSVRGALRLAPRLILATALLLAAATRPAQACATPPVEALAAGLPDAGRHEFAGEIVASFVVLWLAHRRVPLPDFPDRVVVFAAAGHPLLVAYAREGCVIGILPVARDELWAALRQTIGPVA